MKLFRDWTGHEITSGGSPENNTDKQPDTLYMTFLDNGMVRINVGGDLEFEDTVSEAMKQGWEGRLKALAELKEARKEIAELRKVNAALQVSCLAFAQNHFTREQVERMLNDCWDECAIKVAESGVSLWVGANPAEVTKKELSAKQTTIHNLLNSDEDGH